jgi:hypothetical protein
VEALEVGDRPLGLAQGRQEEAALGGDALGLDERSQQGGVLERVRLRLSFG